MAISTATNFTISRKRTVGPGLGLGIFLLPVVFAWAVARPGYSSRVRLMAFGWMALPVLIAACSIGLTDPTAQPTAAQRRVAEEAQAEAQANAQAQAKAAENKRVQEAADERRAAEITSAAGDALDAVKALLRDPASAQFRNVWAIRTPDGEGVVFCGEVNARNGFNGYVGFEPFLAVRHTAYTPESTTVFQGMFSEYCTGGTPLMRVPT